MNELSMLTDAEQFELERKRWVNRRRMAWVSLAFLVVVGLWSMFVASPERLQAVESILSSIVWATASVVGVYMGMSTWAQK